MNKNKSEESVYDVMNRIDEDDAKVIPTFHCEKCGAELNPFGFCDICGIDKPKVTGKYQITIGSPDGTLSTVGFDDFESAHEFACSLDPNEEVAETNQAFTDAWLEYRRRHIMNN